MTSIEICAGAGGQALGLDRAGFLFPEALRLVSECQPKAILLDNVKGLLHPKFRAFRTVGLSREVRQLPAVR